MIFRRRVLRLIAPGVGLGAGCLGTDQDEHRAAVNVVNETNETISVETQVLLNDEIVSESTFEVDPETVNGPVDISLESLPTEFVITVNDCDTVRESLAFEQECYNPNIYAIVEEPCEPRVYPNC